MKKTGTKTCSVGTKVDLKETGTNICSVGEADLKETETKTKTESKFA